MTENWSYRNGFVVYDSGKPGPTFVATHSGLSLTRALLRDMGSEAVAYHAAKRGGSALIALIGRDKINGIDFYRMCPSQRTALEIYGAYEKCDNNMIREVAAKYAFAARDRAQFKQKQMIYDSFWDYAKMSTKPIYIFVHTQFACIKNYPSIVDVATFEGRAFENKILEQVVEKLNNRYEEKFKQLFEQFKSFLLNETSNEINKYKQKFSCFDSDAADAFKPDIENIKLFASKEVLELLNRKFNESTYTLAVQNVLNREKNLKITIERNFNGKVAEFVVLPLIKKTRGVAFQVEFSEFLSQLYPELAADIVWDLIDESREIVCKT